MSYNTGVGVGADNKHMKYSLAKGLGKGITWVLTVAVSFLVVSGYSDISVWGLLEKYAKPALDTLTIGAILTMILNYVKVKFSSTDISS